MLRPEAGKCARLRTHFSCFAKKSKQKKATRSLGPCAALRATCGARYRQAAAELASLRQSSPTARCAATCRLLRSSAQPHGVGDEARRAFAALGLQGLALARSLIL